MDFLEDPEFTGRIVPTDDPAKGPGLVRPSRLGPWTVVYLLNLCVPLYFGWAATRGTGRFGMFLGIFILYGLGARAGLASLRIGLGLEFGGAIVAFFQFLPIAQLSAGLVGLEAASRLERATGRPNPLGPKLVGSELGGFIATVVTGGLLMVAALVIGIVLVTFWNWVGGWDQANPGVRKRRA